MSDNAKNTTTTVITPPAILSYPALFKPRAAQEGQQLKFSAVLVFEKGTDLTGIRNAIVAAAINKFGDKAMVMMREGKLRLPLRTDDVKEKNYPSDSCYMNARSDSQPGIVMAHAGPNGKPLPLTDETLVYPGCIVRAAVQFYGYDKSGNKGVGVGLSHVQVLRSDTPRLDSRRAAEDTFDAVELPPAEMMDTQAQDELSKLLGA